MFCGRERLLVVQSHATGKGLAFEKLEGCTAARGDVAHLVGKPRLLYCADGVSSANDGDAAVGLDERRAMA